VNRTVRTDRMNSTNPLVSVIVPVHNGEKYIGTALESVYAQDYRPFEVIVVDDGSTDDSASIIKRFKEATYIYQKNQGVTIARNVGINASKGELISFIDQDDLWIPEKLSLQVRYLLGHPEIEYVVGRKRSFVEPGLHVPEWFKRHLRHDHAAAFLPGTFMARRSAFKKVGMFDSSYRISSDADWFIRAREASIPMSVMEEVMLHKRLHEDNLSSQMKACRAEVFSSLRSLLQRRRSKNPSDGSRNTKSS